MNIFALDQDPIFAARDQGNKHVVKMPTESAQMMMFVFPEERLAEPDVPRSKTTGEPYKHSKTHFNHPCSRWVRLSRENWDWHAIMALELCEEKQRRYPNKPYHHSVKFIEWAINHIDLYWSFAHSGLTKFAQAMADHRMMDNPVLAYRQLYMTDKRHLAVWKNRKTPTWFQ